MAIEKTFAFHLNLNWETGEIEVRKRALRTGGYWVPIAVRLTLVVPDAMPTITGRVEVPESKVVDFVMEALG